MLGTERDGDPVAILHTLSLKAGVKSWLAKTIKIAVDFRRSTFAPKRPRSMDNICVEYFSLSISR